MAVEARRGCGYRKVGGTYLVGGRFGEPCCKMPIVLRCCPTCGGGVKQTRGWTWVDPRPWLGGNCTADSSPLAPVADARIITCPAAPGNMHLMGERVGLLWIGERFYRTPEEFAVEARTMGISRRISRVPRDFKLGETWVLLAHPKVTQETNSETGETEWLPGIFRIFKPTAIEKVMTESEYQALDEEAVGALKKAGITPVVVPDDDPDHKGTAYDSDAGAK